jgi:hypothetical protein
MIPEAASAEGIAAQQTHAENIRTFTTPTMLLYFIVIIT